MQTKCPCWLCAISPPDPIEKHRPGQTSTPASSAATRPTPEPASRPLAESPELYGTEELGAWRGARHLRHNQDLQALLVVLIAAVAVSAAWFALAIHSG